MNKILSLFLFINISTYLVCIILFAVAFEYSHFNLYLTLTNVLLSLFILWVRRESVKATIKKRFFKNVITQLIRLLLVLSILGIGNFILIKIDKSFDITKSKLNSLASQSQIATKELKEKAIFMLFAKRSDWGRYKELLKLYTGLNAKIDFSIVDVDENPALISLYGVRDSGTLIIKYQGREQKSVITDELSVTNLILRVLKKRERELYFSRGRGELDFFSTKEVGGSYLKSLIKGAGHRLSEIDLRRKIPLEVSEILILDPKEIFLENEIKNLREYLGRGGNLLVLLSPEFGERKLNGLLKVLEEEGIYYMNSLVLDSLSPKEGGSPSIPMAMEYNEKHSITKKMKGRTLFPISGFFLMKQHSTKKVSQIDSLVLSRPFPATWGETNFDEVKGGVAKFNEDKDFKGPLPLAVAVMNTEHKGRIVAFSSGALVQNQFQGQSNNFNLFLNSLSWLMSESELIALERPKARGNLVYLSDINLSFIFYISVLFLPFLFFGIAIFKYRRGLNQ